MTIDELKELEQKATPGPWQQRELICFGEGQSTTPKFSLTSELNRPYPWENDGKLITILRNLAPELITLFDTADSLCKPWTGMRGSMLEHCVNAIKTKLDAMK